MPRPTQPGCGHVAIVGGGPGDPDLITLRGSELLKQADVVLVDHLAPRGLLDGLRPDVEIVDVAKYPHRPSVSQSYIVDVMLDRARAGRRVVRLKGGDPFVFGRGGEEAVACAEAGIDHEVVPGVTSAVAVPGLAGIPVTHRGVSQQFTVVSGHVAPGDPASTVDWEGLGRLGGTLVLLMAVTHLRAITAALVAGGRRADTPAAVIGPGAVGQFVVTATVATIADAAEAAGVAPPAVVVVGDVVEVGSVLSG